MLYRNLITLLLFQSCAYVHHVQIGEVVSSESLVSVPFEILVSENGFNLQEVGSIGKAVIHDTRAGEHLEGITAIIGLFQMGPRTGNPVWSGDSYADKVYEALYLNCPTGQITGLQSIREMNRYPVVSGEIVKIRGNCLKKKTAVTRKKI